MKKLFSLIIIASLMLQSSVFAKDEIRLLSADEAVKKAVEVDKQLSIDKYSTDSLQKIYDDAKKDAEDINLKQIEDDYIYYKTTPDYNKATTERKNKYLVPEQKKSDLDMNKLTIELDKTTAESKAYEAYNNLVKADMDLGVKQNIYNLKMQQYKEMELKYTKGFMSKGDFDIAGYDKESASSEFELAKRARLKALMNLNKILGSKFDTDIRYSEQKFEYKDLKDFDLEKAVETALKDRFEIHKLNEDIRLKKLEFDVIDRYYDDTDSEYKDAEMNLEDAKISLDMKKNDIDYEIRSNYNNLLNMLDTIEMNKREVLKKDILYKIAQLKKSLNMITATELSSSKLEWLKAKVQRDDSIIDYSIAYKKFNNAISVGPGLSGNTAQ